MPVVFFSKGAALRGFIHGVKAYYKKSGLQGVSHYIKMRLYHSVLKPLIHLDIIYWMDPYRVITKRFEMQFSLVDERFLLVGNYYIFDDKSLGKQSVVYSLGVLNETSFDEMISKRYQCKVYMYDPSIIATRHISALAHPDFIFHQLAIWSQPGVMHFSTPKYGGSPSMVLEHSGQRFEAEAITLPQAMIQHGHSHIDILKLDVEGAAIEILKDMLSREILPGQVVAEFERPKSSDVAQFLKYFHDLQCLIDKFVACGYEIHRLPRERYRYYSIELLFTRRSQDVH